MNRGPSKTQMSHQCADGCSCAHWSSPSSVPKKRPDIVQVQAFTGCRQAQRACTSCHTGSPQQRGRTSPLAPALLRSSTTPTCYRCGSSCRCAGNRWTGSGAICSHQCQTMTLRRARTLHPRNEKRGAARGDLITEPLVAHCVGKICEAIGHLGLFGQHLTEKTS